MGVELKEKREREIGERGKRSEDVYENEIDLTRAQNSSSPRRQEVIPPFERAYW